MTYPYFALVSLSMIYYITGMQYPSAADVQIVQSAAFV